MIIDGFDVNLIQNSLMEMRNYSDFEEGESEENYFDLYRDIDDLLNKIELSTISDEFIHELDVSNYQLQLIIICIMHYYVVIKNSDTLDLLDRIEEGNPGIKQQACDNFLNRK